MTARLVGWWDRQQVPLYVAAMALGVGGGLAFPRAAPVLERGINPVLGLLLFATFLGVPLVEVGRGFRDVRFLLTLLIANFVLAPAVAYGLSRFVADDRGLLLGVLLVLLTPCVDYVIVFTGLAGGDRARLLAAAPLLMIVQLLLLPIYLSVFAGPEVVSAVRIGPFVFAFVSLIVAPLAAAVVVQALARTHQFGRGIQAAMSAAMVPLMMATLTLVIASQIHAIGTQASALIRVVPIYVGFVIIQTIIGILVGKTVRLDVPARRAVTFSAVTRNSLVVLPLALVLPTTLGIAPLAVVTQTLVELVAMIMLIRVIPTLIHD